MLNGFVRSRHVTADQYGHLNQPIIALYPKNCQNKEFYHIFGLKFLDFQSITFSAMMRKWPKTALPSDFKSHSSMSLLHLACGMCLVNDKYCPGSCTSFLICVALNIRQTITFNENKVVYSVYE